MVFASMVVVSGDDRGTEITSLPYTINTSGEYYLSMDLVCEISSSAGITIGANDVTIDGNGYKITGTTTPADCAYQFPVMASGVLNYQGYDNLKIYDLEVESFGTGIVLAGSGPNKVHGNEVINCKIHDCGFDEMSGGSDMQTQGIHTYYIQGQSSVPGVVIKGCDVYNIKGTGSGCEGGGNGVFSMGGGSNFNDNLILTCNRLYSNDRAGFSTKQGADHCEITYNEVYDNGNGPGIGTDFSGGIVFRCKSTNYFTVAYNYIHNNHHQTSYGNGIFVGGNYNYIMNNYIVDNDVGINFGRLDGSDYNEIYDNVISNHPYTDVIDVTGTNSGDNNCADTANGYQDDNPASGEDFTYDTSNLVPCYYDFDQDNHYSSAYSFGQNLLNVGICCLPGQYDGSPTGMAHHEIYANCVWSIGDDPHDSRAYTITGEVFDTDGVTPVIDPTVIIKNLQTAQEWDATVENNAFALNIEPELDISPYNMLRITAADAALVEGWTDHKVHDADLALGGYTADVILDNYQLNYYPSYPYYQQEQPTWSGPAVMQACIGHYITPPTQTQLDTEGRDNNLQCNKDASLPYVDPEGMETTMDTYLFPEGRNYAIYNYEDTSDGLNDALHKICYWQKLGPAAVPTGEDYSNWMTIRGIRTSDIPDDYSAPYDYDAIGFWVNDPAVGGIGENMYVAADTWTTTYYKPLTELTVPEDPYNDRYVCIVEPPEDNAQIPEAQVTIKQPIERFVDATPIPVRKIKSIEDVDVVSYEPDDEESLDVVKAAIDGVSTELLPYDSEFADVFAGTVASDPLLVENGDEDYWLVSFIKPLKQIEVKHEKPPLEIQKLDINDRTEIKQIKEVSEIIEVDVTAEPINLNQKTLVVVRVDAKDGKFLDASWVNEGVNYLPIDAKEALDLALEKHNYVQSMGEPTIDLVHIDGSMYYPAWHISIGGSEYFVSQEGSII
jgi:hypothetical protein